MQAIAEPTSTVSLIQFKNSISASATNLFQIHKNAFKFNLGNVDSMGLIKIKILNTSFHIIKNMI
jgi:hypothetical protein